jgi:hypothetical protein
VSTSLLSLALIISSPGPDGLQKGDAFTFSGTVTARVDRPTQYLHREYELCLRLFVLDRQELFADAALLTQLRRIEDAVGGAAKPVTGTSPNQNSPPIIQLDYVRIHADGSVHLLVPVGPPFRLAVDTPVRALPTIPLDDYAPSEFGIFPPRMPRATTPGEPWTVAAGANRPEEMWVAQKKMEFINAEQCRKLVMNQHSPEWEKPVGGKTAWNRADAVWVSTQDAMARKVHRVILQRDGIPMRDGIPKRDGIPIIPAVGTEVKYEAWIDVKYELKDHEKLNGKTYDRTRRDVEVAYDALADAATIIRDAVKLGPRHFEAKITKLDAYLEETAPGTPFREAIVAARRTLDAGRRGDVATPIVLPSASALVTHGRWPEIGESAPNLHFGKTQLSEQRGKPVVLIFLKPGGETTELSLAIVDALQKRYREAVVVVPFVVFGDTSAALKERDRMKLTIPLYEDSSARSTYGVETVPRFAVIDHEGKVKWTFTGVGSETGFLVREQLDRLARPVSPNGQSGITAAPGTATIPPVPRP